jgi:hypothetical protein
MNDVVFQLFKNLLKTGPSAKSQMLQWIGGFLSANKGNKSNNWMLSIEVAQFLSLSINF